MQTSSRSIHSSHSSRSRRRSVATLALVGLAGTLGSFGLSASPAFADDATAPAIVEPVAPVVATQASPEAVAEKLITPVDLKLTVIRSKGAAEIAKRQISLTAGQTKLATQTTDCGFNAARAAEMTATSAGLTALGSQLAATTDLLTAKSLYGKIFTDYRVYLVVLPKTGNAVRCDFLVKSITEFNTAAAKLQVEIDAVKAGGGDTTAAQALKNSAVATVAPLNPTAAITPCAALVPDRGDKAVQAANATALAGCDASLDAIGASMKSARSQLNQARAALKGARSADRDADKAKREADKAAREAKKDADKAKREAEKEARETKKDADKAAREAAKASKKANGNNDDGENNQD